MRVVKEEWKKQVFNIGAFASSKEYKEIFNGKRRIVLGDANQKQIQALVEIGTLDVSKLDEVKSKKAVNDPKS